jgi:AmiR/NasT family two-component response regulator
MNTTGRIDDVLSALRVLVAEDETIIRLDLCQLLERQGLEVCGQARDGVEAVELARELRPDVAVLAVKMPRLDGIEAARRIYAERPLPVVMLTAFGDRRLIERAVDAGAFGYLVKPFREHDLLPAVKAAYARHAELLAARRAVGAQRQPLDLQLYSTTGQLWPLRLGRLPDGSLDVELRREAT